MKIMTEYQFGEQPGQASLHTIRINNQEKILSKLPDFFRNSIGAFLYCK